VVTEGTFREDLYYRINLITLKLPPLRDRPADIPLLVNYFLTNVAKLYNRRNLDIDSKALDWLSSLPWPGNVRQLKNLVERTVLVNPKDHLSVNSFFDQLNDVPKKSSTENLPAVGEMTLNELEKSMILKAVEFHQGNISKVARSLGLTRSAVYRRLEKYGILV